MKIQVVKTLTDVKERGVDEEGIRGAAPVEKHRKMTALPRNGSQVIKTGVNGGKPPAALSK